MENMQSRLYESEAREMPTFSAVDKVLLYIANELHPPTANTAEKTNVRIERTKTPKRTGRQQQKSFIDIVEQRWGAKGKIKGAREEEEKTQPVRRRRK